MQNLGLDGTQEPLHAPVTWRFFKISRFSQKYAKRCKAQMSLRCSMQDLRTRGIYGPQQLIQFWISSFAIANDWNFLYRHVSSTITIFDVGVQDAFPSQLYFPAKMNLATFSCMLLISKTSSSSHQSDHRLRHVLRQHFTVKKH
jgi:hypothetical protein